MTVNDGSNDDDDNIDNNDDHEAIWESLDSDAAVVLLWARAAAVIRRAKDVTVQLCYIYKENSWSSYPEHNYVVVF